MASVNGISRPEGEPLGAGADCRARLFVAAALLLFLESAVACTAPPLSLFRGHESLLTEASAVALVEAVSVQDAPSSCTFRVIRTWKGALPAPLPVVCRTPAGGDWMTDFAGHAEAVFWKERAGRLGVSGACSIIPPAFTIGKQYVLLIGIAPDTKQYEQISGPKDEWLRLVEKTLMESRQ